MKSNKIKAPCFIMEDKEYKLSDFFEEFEEYECKIDYRDNRPYLSSDNVKSTFKNGIYVFSNKIPFCPKCYSRDVSKNSTSERKLIFLNYGEVKGLVQIYKCKKCGKIFVSDLSEIVSKNNNITKAVIDVISSLYSIAGLSLHRIREILYKNHNVDISHQTIENALLNNIHVKEAKNWSYSGYYLFDSLWVKENGIWKYLLCLFDSKSNTIISSKLVKSETTQSIYKFFEESLRNQNVYSITTDLKQEYRKAVQKMNAKHQFCKFHTKKHLNKQINDHIKENKPDIETIKDIVHYKKHIFDLMDSNSLKEAKNIHNMLFNLREELPEIIKKIYLNFILPYFKNLTYYIENRNIEYTTNKIENAFQKIFPKSIKRLMKIPEGITQRFNLKLEFWNERNLQQV